MELSAKCVNAFVEVLDVADNVVAGAFLAADTTDVLAADRTD